VLSAAARLRSQGPRVVLVTSLKTEDNPGDRNGMLVDTEAGSWKVTVPQLPLREPFSGSGDVTAALFLAGCLEFGLTDDGPAKAMGRAVAAVQKLLEATVASGGCELALIAAQDDIVAARTDDVEV